MTKMADSDEIKVEDDPVVEQKVVVVDESNDHDDSGIEILKKRLEMEEQARARYQKEAQQANERESAASYQVQDSNLQLILNAIDNTRMTSQQLRSELAGAMAGSDYIRAAELQEALAVNAWRYQQLDAGKVELERVVQTPPQKPVDIVEQVASQLTPASAAWVRAHPECVRDQNRYQHMLSAHNHAVTEGYQADTPEYFAYVESQLGYRPQQRAMPSRSAPPAAPSSAAASSSGGNKNLVRLSPEERETASLFGMTPEEYAKNKMALKKEGKIN